MRATFRIPKAVHDYLAHSHAETIIVEGVSDDGHGKYEITLADGLDLTAPIRPDDRDREVERIAALGRGSIECSGSPEHSGLCPCHCHTVARLDAGLRASGGTET